MPKYHAPDFTAPNFANAPDAAWAPAEMDGVAPEYYHSTSMFPEYFKVDGKWLLAEDSRMDSCVVICDDGHLEVIEARNLKKGDKVVFPGAFKAEVVERKARTGRNPLTGKEMTIPAKKVVKAKLSDKLLG